MSLRKMELNNGTSHLNEKKPFEHTPSTIEEKTSVGKDTKPFVFVNQGAIVWQESRRKWVGDQCLAPQRMTREPIISWSMAYEDLLSTNDPFTEPIPLPEMVDFLVDIWQDEGLYD